MSRWIDADAMKEKIDSIWNGRPLSLLGARILVMIDEAPSIDIVRCRECKHCSLDVCVERTVSGKERCINICNRHSAEWVVDKDWFCADGERKE